MSGSVASLSHEHENAAAMQQRIDRLEGLVKTLMARGQGQEISHLEDSTLPNGVVQSRDYPGPRSGFDATAGTKDASSVPYNAGTTVLNEGHSVYTASNDWSDVLQEVRRYFFDFSLQPTKAQYQSLSLIDSVISNRSIRSSGSISRFKRAIMRNLPLQ